jgi:hypothetical protein
MIVLGKRSRIAAAAVAAACWGAPAALNAQDLAAPAAAQPAARQPRLLQAEAGQGTDPAALKARVLPYVERHRSDPAWIVSRLQMYWQGRHTQVFIKDSLYHHAEGQAPVPTVRFTGGRDTATAYATPRLEDVKPYMGENDLLYLQSKAAGQPWEWVPQAKTGRIVESINMRIAQLARDAAHVYWQTGDEAYARFAYDIFDTYVSGMYYREPPVDLNRAHDGTIAGLQSYEVIHEDIVGPLAECYDLLRAYAQGRAPAKVGMYDAALKKWADLILANGVPWNNWNLIKARFVLQIAAVLEPDAQYADGHGSGHYVRAVADGSGMRQWSLQRLLDYGYDGKTGMWNESPGYSLNVVNDYLECLEMLERVFGIDLLPKMPVLERAARALPQYLLPNGRMVGFGDTRYEPVRTGAVEKLQARAQRQGRSEEAQAWGALLAALRAGDARAYQTPTFHAPNASWLVQRNGYLGADARDNALVISQAASAGNHAHANGIAMELFAHGLSLAPESGRGSGYLQNDHLQYYAQFPAHNTVVVDGASTYPSMKTDHPFALDAVYPQPGSGAASAFPLATFSDASFVEPATGADQRRVLGTVRLDDKHGYFVDIFRSRRHDGKDKYHDYIYHNLGQSMRFIGADGQTLPTAPSQRLAFADGDLFGYDYWSGRASLKSERPLRARFELQLPDRSVAMTAWLQGGRQREFFSVQAPPSTAWTPGLLPAEVERAPLPTLVIRQTGEAWSHPFTAVLEAARDGAPGSVLGVEELAPGGGHSVALRVTAAGGRQQTIMSNDGDGVAFTHGGLRLVGRYGIAAMRGGALDFLFLGHGREVAGHGAAISAASAGASAALWQSGGHWHYTASHAARLQLPAEGWPDVLALRIGERLVRVAGRAAKVQGRAMRIYDMPAMAAAQIH